MAHVVYDKSHHAGGTAEERLRSRERNSGATGTADHVVQPSQGSRFHNIFEKGQGGAGRRANTEGK